jgi:hypothetical protein
VLVSILVPTLNRRALLERALASALAQTHAQIEIVISDDGSSDGTEAYLSGLVRKDGRLRLAPKNPRPGLFTNLNHLLEQRRGEFFCLLADDDLLAATFVETTLALLTANTSAVACFCGFSLVDDKDTLIGRRATELRATPGMLADVVRHLFATELLLNNVLFRTSALGDLRFDLDCLGVGDWDYNLCAHRRGPFCYTPEPLAFLRVHPAQISSTDTDYMSLGRLRTLERHRFADPEDDGRRLALLQQTRTGYASLLATRQRSACLGLVADYFGEHLRYWRAQQMASLTLSSLRAVLPSPLARQLGRLQRQR